MQKQSRVANFLLPLEPLKCIICVHRPAAVIYIQITTRTLGQTCNTFLCLAGEKIISHLWVILEYNGNAKGGRAVIRRVNCFVPDMIIHTGSPVYLFRKSLCCNSKHNWCQTCVASHSVTRSTHPHKQDILLGQWVQEAATCPPVPEGFIGVR